MNQYTYEDIYDYIYTNIYTHTHTCLSQGSGTHVRKVSGGTETDRTSPLDQVKEGGRENKKK